MVARDVTLPVDREAAWDALTDPEALAQWLGEPTRLELEPGGAAVFTLRSGEERHAIVEEVAPGERLVFWWWEPSPDGPDAAPDAPGTRVEFTLTDAVSGTRVTVTEAPVGPLARGGLCHDPAPWVERSRGAGSPRSGAVRGSATVPLLTATTGIHEYRPPTPRGRDTTHLAVA